MHVVRLKERGRDPFWAIHQMAARYVFPTTPPVAATMRIVPELMFAAAGSALGHTACCSAPMQGLEGKGGRYRKRSLMEIVLLSTVASLHRVHILFLLIWLTPPFQPFLTQLILVQLWGLSQLKFSIFLPVNHATPTWGTGLEAYRVSSFTISILSRLTCFSQADPVSTTYWIIQFGVTLSIA